MANVWFPEVPFVVTANDWGTTPPWPSKSFEPQPHLPTFCADAVSGILSTANKKNTFRIFLSPSGKRILAIELAWRLCHCQAEIARPSIQTALQLVSLSSPYPFEKKEHFWGRVKRFQDTEHPYLPITIAMVGVYLAWGPRGSASGSSFGSSLVKKRLG